MANFLNPTLSSLYSDLVDDIKDRDEDIMKWLDGTSATNIPSGSKRWNSTSNLFEKYNGTTWESLTTEYEINVNSVNNCSVDDLGTSTSDLWSANKITNTINTATLANTLLTKIKTVDGIGSGLDADKLDGKDSTYFQNTEIIEW